MHGLVGFLLGTGVCLAISVTHRLRHRATSDCAALMTLALRLESQGRFEAAVDACLLAVEVRPAAILPLDCLARAVERGYRLEAVAGAYERMADAGSRDPRDRYWHGCALARLGDTAGARRCWEEAASRDGAGGGWSSRAAERLRALAEG